MKKLYTQNEVSRLMGISQSQIRYWDRTGLIPCTDRQKGSLLFDFTALVSFRTVKELLDKGISTRKIRKYLEALKKKMPEIKNLTEVSIAIYGNQVVIGKDNLKFTPEGQILINFSKKQAPIPLTGDSADELFFQALECEYMGDWNQAQKKYEFVLSMNPEHSDVLVNLGNIRYRAGSREEAEQYYRKALRANPDHVEANYNLANLFEERDDLDNAVLFYAKSVHEDPEFSDAHFNLGMVLEKLGDIQGAKRHWRIYLDLDPASEWAEYLKQRLHGQPPTPGGGRKE